MSPAKHLAICAEIQQLHQVRLARLEAQKREWVGLTAEEIQAAWDSPELTLKPPTPIYSFVERLAAKLKEKNT